MLTALIHQCYDIHALYAAISDLQPMGHLGAHDVRIADVSDTILISLIANKFLEISNWNQNPTHEEQIDYQKTLDKVKSLNEDAFTELRKKYFEQNLQAYLSDPNATGYKQLAVKKIRKAFDTNPTEFSLKGLKLNKLPFCFSLLTHLEYLDLSENQLSELPDTLTQLVALRFLNLRENQLTRLPDMLGQLVALQSLYLEENLLTVLPDTLGRLVELRALHLEANRLTKLPDTIGQLVHLTDLNLRKNCLTQLPNTLGQLVELQILDLQENSLTALPDTLGQLVHLTHLYLINNQLTWLPTTLGGLVCLKTLEVEENHNLRELPLILGSLPELIFIGTESTDIDPQLVRDLLARCAHVRRAQGVVVLSNRLQTWKTASNIQIDLSGIERCTDDEKRTLNEWLVRLERMPDFRGNQQLLAQVICKMLYSMTQHEELKALFLAHMTANNENCEDRAAQALNELYTLWIVYELPKKSSLQEKLGIMIRGAKTLALRAAVAACIKNWEQANHSAEQESVEIYLFYEIALKEQLDLLNIIQTMLYSAIGQRDWINTDELVTTVQKSYIDHLIDLPIFAKILEHDERFQSIWGSQDNAFVEALNALPQTMTSQHYLVAARKIENERNQKHKETVEQWLVSCGIK